MILEFPSGDVSLDRAAWGGITGASPYPPLPKDFKGQFLELRFGFYYNLTRTSFVEGKNLAVPVDPEFRKRQIYGLLLVAVILLLAGLGRSSCTISFRRGGGEFGRGDSRAFAGCHPGADRSGKTPLSVALAPALRR